MSTDDMTVMRSSHFTAETNAHFVTVWPSMTGESGFFDVVSGPLDNGHATDPCDLWPRERVTAFEAATAIATEIGGNTADIERAIVRWIKELAVRP